MTRTVLEKLGFKPGMRGWVVGRPDDLSSVIDLPGEPHPAPDFICRASRIPRPISFEIPTLTRKI